MIGLRRNGQYLKLLPGTTVPWEVEDDIFDFDYVGQAFSWEFDIPRSANETFFNFAGAPENPRNEFRVYTDFELTTDGFIFWKVNLILKRSNRTLYSIEVSNLPDGIIANKDINIRDLIDEQIPVASGDFSDFVDSWNTTNSNMVFPYMYFKSADGGYDFPVNTLSGRLLPVFKGIYLVRLCCQALGYQFSDQFSVYNSDINRLFFHSNRLIDTATSLSTTFGVVAFDRVNNVIDVAKYAPDITFLKLMRDLAILSGGSISVNDELKRVEIRAVSREQAQAEYVDLSADIDPEQLGVEIYEPSDFDLAFPDSDLFEKVPTEIVGRNLGEVADFDTFEATPDASAGDYAFSLLDNAYVQFFQFGTTLYAKRIGEPFQEYKAGNSGNVSLLTTSVPAPKDKYAYKRVERSLKIIDNGFGFCRVTGFTIGDLNTDVANDVFLEENGDPIYPPKWHDQTNYDNVNYEWLDLGTPYVSEVSIKAVMYRRENDYYSPRLVIPLHYPEQNFYSEKFPSVVCIWHGMQDTLDGSGSFPMVSADPYDSRGVKIGQLALRFHQSDSLVEHVYTPLRNLLRTTRIYKWTGLLSVEKIRQLYLLKIARFDGGKFRVRKISTTIGDDGPEFVEIEGYRI